MSAEEAPSESPSEAAGEGEAVIEVSDLRVQYGRGQGIAGKLRRRPEEVVRAVDGVSLVVRRGEMLALVGESGCGKTSTALAMLRMIEPASGTIRFKGRDVTDLSPRQMRPLRRHMQMIYQDPYESLDPRRRVGDTVEEPLLVHRGVTSAADRRARVHQALEAAELDPEAYLERFPEELSGGQRQRVAIAASLVLGPALLIADEPVSMLDVSVRAGVLALLDRLRRVDGMAILMITHDLSTAARFATRIAVMYLGRVVEEGPAQEVLRRPRHPYTKALLSVVPRRDDRDGPPRQILVGETPDPSLIPPGCRFHPRCPVALPSCRSTDPELRKASGSQDSGHLVACVLETDDQRR
ncbi:MAG: ABC transporter ATP-binding protein [Acidimicrobiales bacterium]